MGQSASACSVTNSKDHDFKVATATSHGNSAGGSIGVVNGSASTSSSSTTTRYYKDCGKSNCPTSRNGQ